MPIVVAPVPDLKFPPRNSSLFLILPECVQLGEAAIGDVELEHLLLLHFFYFLLVFLLRLFFGHILILCLLFGFIPTLFLLLWRLFFDLFFFGFLCLVNFHYSCSLLFLFFLFLFFPIHLNGFFCLLRNLLDFIIFRLLFFLFGLRTCSCTRRRSACRCGSCGRC